MTQTMKQSNNQLINQSINRSINRSIVQSVNQSINQSINRSIANPVASSPPLLAEAKKKDAPKPVPLGRFGRGAAVGVDELLHKNSLMGGEARRTLGEGGLDALGDGGFF
jgi:hypothetical protein